MEKYRSLFLIEKEPQLFLIFSPLDLISYTLHPHSIYFYGLDDGYNIISFSTHDLEKKLYFLYVDVEGNAKVISPSVEFVSSLLTHQKQEVRIFSLHYLEQENEFNA